MKRILTYLPVLFLTATTLLAQTATPEETSAVVSASPEASISGGALAAIMGLGLLPIIIGIAIYLGIAIWVTKDAKRRHSPNATLVTILVWIPCGPLPLIGLIVHLVTRPKTIPS